MDDPPVYGIDDDDIDFEEDDDGDNDDDASSSYLAAAEPISSAGIVTVASAADHSTVLAIPAAAAADRKPIAAAGLFQRLWTDEDEIELLRGFLEYTSQRGGAHHSSQHHDTAAFYDQIKCRLQLDFNKNQLVEKLRRLKKKYRTVMGKINSGKEYVFKSPHDQATFEISKKIWYEPETRIAGPGLEEDEFNPNNRNIISFHQNDNGVDLNSKGSARPRKRAKPAKSEEVPLFTPQVPQIATPVMNSVPGLIEETVRTCLTPILKELVNSVTSSSRGFGGMGGIGGMDTLGFSFGSPGPLGYTGGGETGNAMDEKWRKQKILELEVYSKRLALVQEQIKSTMDELRLKGS